jgi:hypothetical protein
VTYRNSEGPFKATGFPNQEFPIPSPADAKISAETAPEIEIRKREVIHVPALPTRELFNLGSIGNQPLIYLSGVASGSPLRLWCPECPSNSGNTVGFWKTVNVNQNLNGFHHSLASGPSSALLLSSHSTTLSLTTIQENFALVRQSLGLDYNGSLNGIASGPDAFIAVGTATAPGSPITGGLIARKAFGEPWEDIFIPEVREFLHIYHLNLGWVAPAKGGSIWTSTDGSEWAQTGTAPFDLAKLVESEGRWLGATTNGEIYSSTDLMSWTRQLEHTALTQGLVATESHFFAMVGNVLRLSPLAADGSPDITSQPPSPAILSGESATLSIVATGENLTYQWYQGISGDLSSPIESASTSNFQSATDKVGEFSYWLQIINLAGSINYRTISVKVFARDYQEWASQYGLAPEARDRQASAAVAEFTNLFRYLARLSPFAPAATVFQNQPLYRTPETGNYHLALWVRTRPLPSDYFLIVEESQTLKFDGNEAVPTGDEISDGDGSTSRRYRTSFPLTS